MGCIVLLCCLQVSPHEFMQAVMAASKRRFTIEQQSDPVEFWSWLLNTLHLDLTGVQGLLLVVPAVGGACFWWLPLLVMPALPASQLSSCSTAVICYHAGRTLNCTVTFMVPASHFCAASSMFFRVNLVLGQHTARKQRLPLPALACLLAALLGATPQQTCCFSALRRRCCCCATRRQAQEAQHNLGHPPR